MKLACHKALIYGNDNDDDDHDDDDYDDVLSWNPYVTISILLTAKFETVLTNSFPYITLLVFYCF